MTATTLIKGIAVFCFILGLAFFLVGGYYLWNMPLEHGWEAVMAIVAGFVLHTIFYALWP